jgi:hypothetical protein
MAWYLVKHRNNFTNQWRGVQKDAYCCSDIYIILWYVGMPTLAKGFHKQGNRNEGKKQRKRQRKKEVYENVSVYCE